MKAGELCVRDVVTAFARESVVEAARRMAEYNVGDLIVVEPASTSSPPRPIGIITDRDLVVQVLARPDRVAPTVTIGDVMRDELVVAREADEVEDVVATMRERAIRRIPIVDDRGELQGLLSIDDVFGWMRDQMQVATRTIERQGRGPRQSRALP